MKYAVLFSTIGLVFSLNTPVLAQISTNSAGSSAEIKPEEVEINDERVSKLRAFLESYESPLVPFARDFVEVADKYDLDWRLLPAISGTESTFGKRFPQGSYNPFGWGIYGDQVLRFKSFREAMEAVANGLKARYPKEALKNMYRLGRIYNGVTPSSWSSKVMYFMKKLEDQPITVSQLSLSV